MVGSDLIRAGIVGLIPVVSGWSVGLVVVLVFILAAVSSFFRPARTAALPQVVPDEDLLTANSAMWIADTVSDLVGYGLGGLFVAFLGSSLALAFWLDGASYLASAALVAAVVIPPIVRMPRAALGAAGELAPGTSIQAELQEGWRFLHAETVLFATTIQAAIAEYGLGALTTLTPLLVASLRARQHGRADRLRLLRDGHGYRSRGRRHRRRRHGRKTAQRAGDHRRVHRPGRRTRGPVRDGQPVPGPGSRRGRGSCQRDFRRAQPDAVPAADAERDARDASWQSGWRW